MTRQIISHSQCPFRWQPMPISVLIWVRSFIEPDLFGPQCTFDNTTPIYLINLPWKLGLGLGLDLKMHKWGPALAGKAKAGTVHSVSGWMQGVQVKLWDPLRTLVIPEHFKGVFTTRRYTNPRLPLPMLFFFYVCYLSVMCFYVYFCAGIIIIVIVIIIVIICWLQWFKNVLFYAVLKLCWWQN